MSPADAEARKRYYIIAAVHILATAGSVFGLVLAGRSTSWPLTMLGGAIVLSGLYVMVIVPKALAHRWRTPPEQ